jgi:hypothetical protein
MNGVNFTQINDKYVPESGFQFLSDATLPHVRGEQIIPYWKLESWMQTEQREFQDEAAFYFASNEGSVEILKDGIYYVYSQFYFYTSGTSDCCYRISYGPGNESLPNEC